MSSGPVIEIPVIMEDSEADERPGTPIEIPDYTLLEDDEWFPGVPRYEDVTPLRVVGRPIKLQPIKQKFDSYMATQQISLEEASMKVPELIKKYGYPCEIHNCETQDGYLLEMHRIPHGKSVTQNNQVPILVVHGLLCSSADWVIPGPGVALGYLLVDRGYDVWLANCRGNTYSRKHNALNPNRSKFWNYSFQEIANYDLPAMIDYILKLTKKDQVYYVGHSQGTTAFYALCSLLPSYNNKIAAMISLAPVAYMDNMVSPMLRLLSTVGGSLELVTGLFGNSEFMPHSKLLSFVAKYFAADGSPFQILFTNSLFMMCGFSPKEMNTSLLPIIMGHTPAGISTKQILHYGQEWRSTRFCKWDKGFLDNMLSYGQFRPPKFNPSAITCPIYLFYSRNDWISSDIDVGRFFLQLEGAKIKESILVGDGKYNHLDYLYGINAPTKVYNRVMEKLQVHSGL